MPQAAGAVGVAATALVAVAVAFAIDAIGYARRCGRRGTYVLMALPAVIGAAWIGGLRLLPAGRFSAGNLTLDVVWLLIVTAIMAVTTARAVIALISTRRELAATARVPG